MGAFRLWESIWDGYLYVGVVSFIIYVKDSVCQDSVDAVDKTIQDSEQIKGILVFGVGGVCSVFVYVGFFVYGSNGHCVIVGRGARTVAGLFCG